MHFTIMKILLRQEKDRKWEKIVESFRKYMKQQKAENEDSKNKDIHMASDHAVVLSLTNHHNVD